MWLCLAGCIALAGPADPRAIASADALGQSGARARAVVEACRAHPEGCTDEGSRRALGRAFYTRVLADWVHGAPFAPEDVANVHLLDEDLHARLPDGVRQHEGSPSDWVVSLVRPTPAPPEPPAPAPRIPVAVARAADTDVAELPSPPDPPPLVAAARSLRSGDPAAAAARLHELAEGGHKKARALLAVALEELELPSAALLVLEDLLSDPSAELYAPYVTPQAVRLAERIGSRRPLVGLAAIVRPESWGEAVRSDAWLARGQHHQDRGELAWALRAFRQIAPTDDATVEGAWRAGRIYRQIEQPWSAVRSFRDAWNAQAGHGPYVDLLRDASAWSLAALYDELGRTEDAIGTYEVLTLTGSPLAARSALRSASSAARLGDVARARMLLAPLLDEGNTAETELLQARLALVDGDAHRADRHLAAAVASLTALERSLRDALSRHDDLWTRAADLHPELRARLETEPTLVAFDAELDALAGDRARLRQAGLGPELGGALDARLAAREEDVRARASTALYHVLSELEREVEAALALATRLRR